jgi:hypothetical protein
MSSPATSSSSSSSSSTPTKSYKLFPSQPRQPRQPRQPQQYHYDRTPSPIKIKIPSISLDSIPSPPPSPPTPPVTVSLDQYNALLTLYHQDQATQVALLLQFYKLKIRLADYLPPADLLDLLAEF